MPLGIKDIIETADMANEQGSPLFVGCHTGRDAASVAAPREVGAVILGKVVTTEFASTEPRGTRNPWDSAHTGRIPASAASSPYLRRLPVSP
jgi:Asp-tRNA(Asn)/Glu-tRNA(Gln) amidotransferase A subunit family amidase